MINARLEFTRLSIVETREEGVMIGRSVAWLILACFLSSCGSSNESGIQSPADAGLIAGTATPTFTPPDRPTTAVQATKGEILIQRNNCLEITGITRELPSNNLVSYEYCYYSYRIPQCATELKECRSTPPSGKCALTGDPPTTCPAN